MQVTLTLRPTSLSRAGRTVCLFFTLAVASVIGACGQARDSGQEGELHGPIQGVAVAEGSASSGSIDGATTAIASRATQVSQLSTASVANSSTYNAADVLDALKAAHGRNSGIIPHFLDTDANGTITIQDARVILDWALRGVHRPNRNPVIYEAPDLVLVANREITGSRIVAADPDSTPLTYTVAPYSTDDLKLRELLGWPRSGPLADFGLTLNNATGLISGTPVPSPVTRSAITAIATDAAGASDSKKFTLEILTESLGTYFRSIQDGAVTNELHFTAVDTSRGGTVAYCITTDAEVPKPSNPCFKTDAQGGRTLSVPINAGAKIPRHYLYTKDANENVLLSPVPVASGKPLVFVNTEKGPFVIELESEKAKVTTENFLNYVDSGFFTNTVFHRVISQFVIQGGGFVYNQANPTKYAPQTAGGGLRDPIVLEKTGDTGLTNTRGTIAMARTSVANSATSQFFINVVDNSGSLDAGRFDSYGYAVFGRVIPPVGGVPGDLPKTIRDIMAVPVSGSMGGTGQIAPSDEQSAPVGRPPTVTSVWRLN